MAVATWVLVIIAVYAAAGLAFAVAFAARGVTVVDHAARGSRWTFRLLIVPGAAMLWPVLAPRWLRARGRS